MERCPRTTDGQHLRSYRLNELGEGHLICRACGQELDLREISSTEDLRDHPGIETR